MADFPYLPLWTDAFIADTGHLTPPEIGAYVMLLFSAWRSPDCNIPNDDIRLARMARCDTRTWAKCKAAVMAFWTLENGFYTQKRLTRERNLCYKSRIAKSKGAEAANEAKRLKSLNLDDAERCANDLANATQPITTPIKEERKEEPKKVLPKEKRGSRLPDDFEPDASCHAVAEEMLLTSLQSQLEFEKFKDYWKGKAGAAGIKLDWQATFRNWLRNAKGNLNGHHQTNHKHNSIAGSLEIASAIIDEALEREAERETEISAEYSYDDSEQIPRLQQIDG
jgi:uncharacterized protein YdaU (DUF1376 family)